MASKKLLYTLLSTKPIERREPTSKRFDSVNVIKSVGVLFVILVHTCFPIHFYERSIHDPVMWPLVFIYCVLLTCVPLFICMTGFLTINKTFQRKHYLGWFKYFIPYVLILIVQFIYSYIKHNSISSIFNVFSIYTNGYMCMFFGIYLLAPFLNTLWANLDGYQKCYLLIILIFLTIIPSVTGAMFNRYWSPLCPFLYYYTGTFLRDYRIKLKNSFIVASALMICFLETIYVIFFSYDVINMGFFWNEYQNYCNTYYILPTYFLTVLIIVLLLNKTDFSRVTLKLAECFSAHSLEMYLISSVFVQGICWNYVTERTDLTDNQLLLISPIVVLIEIVITYMLSVIIKKISAYLYNWIIQKVNFDR